MIDLEWALADAATRELDLGGKVKECRCCGEGFASAAHNEIEWKDQGETFVSYLCDPCIAAGEADRLRD